MTMGELGCLSAPQFPYLLSGNMNTYDLRVYSKAKMSVEECEAVYLGHEGSTDGK